MKKAICTVATGEFGDRMLAISGPLLARYADRIGADFHVFHRASSPYPMAEKFLIRPLVSHYDRTAFLDTDVILDPDSCPDIFQAVPEGFVGGHDDGPRCGVGWVQDETDAICKAVGVPPVKIERVINTGVIVCDRVHAPIWEQPPKPYPRTHCSEQNWIGRNIVAHGFEFFSLDERWNYQWWFDKKMPTVTERPDIHVRHFAGQSQLATKEDRLADMKLHAGKGFIERAGRRCLNLLERTEMKAGCQGYGCAHKCERSLPAVPGGFCQSCWRFEDDGVY